MRRPRELFTSIALFITFGLLMALTRGRPTSPAEAVIGAGLTILPARC